MVTKHTARKNSGALLLTTNRLTSRRSPRLATIRLPDEPDFAPCRRLGRQAPRLRSSPRKRPLSRHLKNAVFGLRRSRLALRLAGVTKRGREASTTQTCTAQRLAYSVAGRLRKFRRKKSTPALPQIPDIALNTRIWAAFGFEPATARVTSDSKRSSF